MAAMKLYYGDNLVGGEVDLAEFEQLKTDVEGKFDKGEDSVITGDRDYDNAALMEMAIKGNTTEIDSLNSKLDEWLANDKPELIVELQNLFPKYTDDDDDQTALMYDSAAKMGIVVAKNEQDIVTGDAATLAAAKTHSDDNDAVTLAAANTHSDDNDAVTLQAANDYTDNAVQNIPGIDELEKVENEAVRNANIVAGLNPPSGVMQIAVVGALPNDPDPNTLYVVGTV
jgi:hypothetical protein